MKHSPRPRRSRSSLSSVVQQHLNSYALTAAAAGVSLMALSQPAEAEIVYTPADQIINRNSGFRLDLNNDGIPDFRISDMVAQSGFGTDQILSAIGPPGNVVKCVSSFCISSFIYAAPLETGSLIGPGERGWLRRAPMAFEEFFRPGSTLYTWGWCNVSDRYLGLKFQINGETHFGWARLSVKFHRGALKQRSWEAHLTGYAYETTPNTAIKAGQMKGTIDDAAVRPDTRDQSEVATTERSSLGTLALGAAALRHSEE